MTNTVVYVLQFPLIFTCFNDSVWKNSARTGIFALYSEKHGFSRFLTKFKRYHDVYTWLNQRDAARK